MELKCFHMQSNARVYWTAKHRTAQRKPKIWPFLSNPHCLRLGSVYSAVNKPKESRCLYRTAPHTSSSAMSSKPSLARDEQCFKMDHCRPQQTISETRNFEWCDERRAFFSECDIRYGKGSVYTEKLDSFQLICLYTYYFIYTENSIQRPHINHLTP
jgi:hypothetical protein